MLRELVIAAEIPSASPRLGSLSSKWGLAQERGHVIRSRFETMVTQHFSYVILESEDHLSGVWLNNDHSQKKIRKFLCPVSKSVRTQTCVWLLRLCLWYKRRLVIFF